MRHYMTLWLLIMVLVITPSGSATIKPINDHLISVNFHNIQVPNLLRLIAEFSQKNVVISPKVTGNISIHLRQVTWREALNVILTTANLAQREDRDIIYIMPTAEVMTLDNAQAKEKAVLNLHYAKAKDLAALLKTSGLLSPNGSSSADLRTNSLLIEDIPNRLVPISQYVQSIDIPMQQILITARIVSADTDFARELGIKFGTTNTNDTPQNTAIDTSSNAIDYGHFELTVAKLGAARLLDMEIAALESEGRGKVISSPKLITGNRITAYIESGSEIPYQEKASHGATSVAFKKAVLSLKVTPEIVSATKLNLTLQLNQDKVSQLTVNGVPAIDTRRIQTQVLVNNGETVILGGIYEWANSQSITRVPFLGKIPLLGVLFSHQEIKRERKELLMFVTPRIIG